MTAGSQPSHSPPTCYGDLRPGCSCLSSGCRNSQPSPSTRCDRSLGGWGGSRLRHTHFADGKTENLGQPRCRRVRLGDALWPEARDTQGNSFSTCPWLTGQARGPPQPPSPACLRASEAGPARAPRPPGGLAAPQPASPLPRGSLPLRRGVGNHLLHVDPAADLREVRVVGL